MNDTNNFRELRRINQAVSPEECRELLKREKRGILAVIGDNGYPYALPMDFFYDENEDCIYFHSAVTGHKLDSIRNCSKVCFTVHNEGYQKDDWSYYVTSAVIFGRAELMPDGESSREALKKLGVKYYPDEKEVDELISRTAGRVQMIRLNIEHMSGKLVHEK